MLASRKNQAPPLCSQHQGGFTGKKTETALNFHKFRINPGLQHMEIENTAAGNRKSDTADSDAHMPGSASARVIETTLTSSNSYEKSETKANLIKVSPIPNSPLYTRFHSEIQGSNLSPILKNAKKLPPGCSQVCKLILIESQTTSQRPNCQGGIVPTTLF